MPCQKVYFQVASYRWGGVSTSPISRNPRRGNPGTPYNGTKLSIFVGPGGWIKCPLGGNIADWVGKQAISSVLIALNLVPLGTPYLFRS